MMVDARNKTHFYTMFNILKGVTAILPASCYPSLAKWLPLLLLSEVLIARTREKLHCAWAVL